MRIKALRLAWFRGAADPVTLGADGKSWGIYGCNGAGKSSFVDSIEYGIKGGKIGHLVSEYSGRNQENAIPNTHTPANRNTAFCITFQDDSELNVKIARNGTHTRAGADAIGMQDWDYRRTVLRQDEVAEFIRSRKGEKYSALLPLFGLHELEVAAENLRHALVESRVYTYVQGCTALYRAVHAPLVAACGGMPNTGDSRGFRLDLGEPLATQLADFCKANFRGKTQVIREALTEYFERQKNKNERPEKAEKKRVR